MLYVTFVSFIEGQETHKKIANMQNPVVLTLDAGGTNLIFSALKVNEELVTPLRLPSNADNLDKCIQTIIQGFEQLREQLNEDVSAISFAFPGPADYRLGVIGDLPNFPSFRGGVPLGPILENHFNLPVFINNDGDLFAYGEALMGYLPWLNDELKTRGAVKTFRNLIGLTLGTGFGAGIVLNKSLLVGDNSVGAEIHNATNKFHPEWNAEESVSTRAIQRVYAESAGLAFNASMMPVDIYNIAHGKSDGNAEAALEAFRLYGENLGNSIASILTFIDGIVVLGGGIVASWDLFSPAMFKELSREIINFKGDKSPRLSYSVYNLEDESVLNEFAKGKTKTLQMPDGGQSVEYDSMARLGVGVSKLSASRAISLGACAYALQEIRLRK